MSVFVPALHNAKMRVATPRLLRSLAMFLLTLLFVSKSVVASNHVWMDDANKTAPAADPLAPSIQDHLFPRVFVLGVATPLSPDRYGKYHQISGQGWELEEAGQVQQNYPDVQYLRQMSPRAYQGLDSDYCRIGNNMAFEGTGAITQGGPQSKGCDMYAGHWLYNAGTTLTQPINNTTKILKIADVSKIEVGQYIVIYDAPAGSFNNAEHAKVVSKNSSTKTITLQSRGYKSNPSAHSSGAIVAQHTRGQGEDPRLWAYNLSTMSPTDGNGKTMSQAMAEWFKNNYNKSPTGGNSSTVVSGIVFDADSYFEIKDTDANNDLITDGGMGANGENWWGDGLNQFYALVRAKLPHLYILGGTPNSRGFESLNGTQMESWPVDNGTNFIPDPKYDNIDHLFSTYRFHASQHAHGAPVVHNLTKNPTLSYPESGSAIAASNKSFRFALGLTLLDNGYFGRKTTNDVFDPWYDEFAVNVDNDSADYGTAMLATDIDGARQHRGWLGSPTGPYTRVYADQDFAAEQSLLSNGSFDSNLNDWMADNVNISHATSAEHIMDGFGAIRASKQTTYQSKVGGARIRGQKISLIKDNWYTMAFSAKASANRQIKAAVGPSGHKLLIGTDWHRYVISFKAKSTGDQRITFSIGKENTEVWLDSIYVFEGNANIFRRDFENGIVVVNSTPTTQTIDLEGVFQRINGTQSAVNDGSTLSQVILPPYDAAVLVRPNDSGGGGGSSNIKTFLTPDVLDANSYGHEFGSDQNESVLMAEFEKTDVDLRFTVTGYDIDTADEVAVRLNGILLGYLSPSSANNSLNAGDLFEISASQQITGTNIIEFRQKVIGQTWGVQNLLLSTQVLGDVHLTLNVLDFGSYGSKFGSNEHLTSLKATFANTGQNLEFSVFGYDIDITDEVSVYLNGRLLGYLALSASNNSLNLGNVFEISASQQISGINTIEFRQKTYGWIWGVTDMLLSSQDSGDDSPTDACGTPGNYDPGVTSGIFVWKDCENQQWSLRVASGGATTALSFAGSVVSDVSMDMIAGYKVEERSDRLTISDDNTHFDFLFKVIKKGDDGVDFELSPSAVSACMPVSQDGTTYVGQNAVVINSSLNLLNPGSVCQ